MIARAPGKVVLSGAYAVLEGAPAIVAAVDRYALADTDREPDRVTPEVAAALEGTRHRSPWFDASELRSQTPVDRKLGLGSSAAILVASLGAIALEETPDLEEDLLAQRVFGQCLAAHRRAQGGGSGIDVAASTMGGTLRFRVYPEAHAVPHRMPPGVKLAVYASEREAFTPKLVALVTDLRARSPSTYARLLDDLCLAADRAVQAPDAGTYVASCRAQLEGFERLGAESGAPIVTDAVRQVDAAAVSRGAVFLPSGAGGGDIALWVGAADPDESIDAIAHKAGLQRLTLSLGARGLHRSERRPG